MRRSLLKKQPTWGLRRAQGTGQKSTTPATLTKVILVLLTMFLLPSTAWGQDPAISIYYDDGLYFVSDLAVKYKWNNEGDGTEFVSGNRIPVQAGTLTYWAEGDESNTFTITYYGLIIGDTPLTNKNVDDINGAISGISNVSFTAPATLNLNGATINVSTSGIIWKGTSDLTIQFSGNNKIDCTQSSGNNNDGICIFGNGKSLTLTAGTDASSLTLTPHPSSTESNNKPAISGFTSVSLTEGWGMYYTDDYSTATPKSPTAGKEVLIAKPYGLSVAGVEVTSANCGDILDGENAGKVSFTPTNGSTPATLTLNNATISSGITTSLDALTINLGGTSSTSSLSGGISCSGSATDKTLAFSGTGSLTISNENEIVFYGFTSVTPGDGLYIATDNPNNILYATSATISTKETYPIWVYNMTSGKYIQLTDDAILDGAVSYNGSKQILTLNNFVCNETSEEFVFHVGGILTNLTVDLVGTNGMFYNCFYYHKPAGGENLQLTYTTSSSNGRLEFSGGPTYNYVDCAYDDGLGFYSTTISTDWPRLRVGDTLVRGTVSSVGDYDNISYDDETKTLTLSGTTIGSQSSTATAILVYIKDLKVAISGSNTLYGYFDGEFSSAGTISFQNTDHINASLTITAKDMGLVEYFAQCTLGDGLKITEAKNYIDENNTVDVDVDGISYVDGNFKNGEDVPDYLKIAYQAPQLTVAGIEPDANGKFEGLTGVTYTPPTLSLDSQTPDTPATLTLDNATIAGDIRSTLTSLTIHLIGESTLNPGDGVAPFLFTEGSGSGSLTFESTEKEEGNLLVTNGNTYYKRTLSNLVRQDDVTDPVYVVSNTFDEYGNTGDWQLAFDTPSENDLQIYRNVKYNLWVTYDGIDYQYTKANRSSIVYGPNYDPENKALEFSGDYTNPIKSSMDELNLKILKINNYGSLPQITFIPIVDVQETGALNIILESSEETAEMVFGSTTNTEAVISGFTTVNYDGFTILSDGAKYDTDKKKLVDASGTPMTLAKFTTSVELARPYFESASEDGMVLLAHENAYTIGSGTESQEINYGTIKYSIVYADGSEGVTDALYTSDFTISKPATVTAKVTLNGKESANAIGKYFGASKEEFTVAIGDKIEGTSWFTPVIESGDQIESKFMLQENDESGIFEMGGEGPDHYLVAKKSGETTVIAYLFNSSNSSSSSTGTTVLNVSEEPILITFTVGESLSSVFEGNNNYGGLYNDSDTPYAVPEGMTAYLVTGISEDGTSVATQDIGYLPARTAVLLLKGEGAKAITKIPYEGSATVPTNNKFYYSDPNNPATAPTTRSWYVIYNNKFMKVTGGTKVNGGKCYLDLGTTAGTRGFYNIGGGEGTTSLREVKTDGVNNEKWTDGEWYTLQGQRVTKPAKGLYILNGKKVVVK